MSDTAAGIEGPALRADARRNRDRILGAAIRHFSAHGVGASLEEIAREAGVGAGTLYRHFPSREALLAAVLRDRQAELVRASRAAQAIADPDAALGRWLEALQDHLRSFDGLPAPVLAAVREQASPLALSCDSLLAITGEFLARAQAHGHARASVTAGDLFLGALGIAWVLNRAGASGTPPASLNRLLAHGYLTDGATPETPDGGKEAGPRPTG